MSNNQLLCVQDHLSITRLIEYMKFFSCLLMTYAYICGADSCHQSSDKIVKHSNIINDIDINNQDLEEELEQFNPLVEPLSWWYGFYRRIRLVPWWLRYNIGMAEGQNNQIIYKNGIG